MHRHANTFPAPAQIGSNLYYPPYQPTYRFWGKYLDRFHKRLANAPYKDNMVMQLWVRKPTEKLEGIPLEGWMSRPEALKLYEMAYYAKGDILEIGSYQGLSTYICAHAIHHSHRSRRIYSLDIFHQAMRMAKWHLAMGRVLRYARFVLGDAVALTDGFARTGKQFAMCFVDFSHAYQPVYEVCRLLHQVVKPGGFALFHDFNDPRNGDPAHPDYGVYQAVIDGLEPRHFEFYGLYGGLAMYRRK